MNSSETNRKMGRVARVSIRLARLTAVVSILTSSLALAWAASRTNGSRTEIQVKASQPKLLHPKAPSIHHGQRQRAGHHPTKPALKSHKHGQQSAQQAGTPNGNSTGGKHGSQSQPDTTPIPEESPTPTPELSPDSSPMATPLSSNIDESPIPR